MDLGCIVVYNVGCNVGCNVVVREGVKLIGDAQQLDSSDLLTDFLTLPDSSIHFRTLPYTFVHFLTLSIDSTLLSISIETTLLFHMLTYEYIYLSISS
jgi:hypothetical protein